MWSLTDPTCAQLWPKKHVTPQIIANQESCNGAYVIESLSVVIDPATNALVNNELAYCLGILAVLSELAIQWAANPCDDSSS